MQEWGMGYGNESHMHTHTLMHTEYSQQSLHKLSTPQVPKVPKLNQALTGSEDQVGVGAIGHFSHITVVSS